MKIASCGFFLRCGNRIGRIESVERKFRYFAVGVGVVLHVLCEFAVVDVFR